MKLIALTQGKFAQVDDEDFDYLNQFKWRANGFRTTWYAKRDAWINGKKKTIRMHREILGVLHEPHKEIDHRDRNGLNNQRSNIWICTRKENCNNRRPRRKKSPNPYGSRRERYWKKRKTDEN